MPIYPQTGLHKALAQHQPQIATQALQHGAWRSDIHKINSDGLTALHIAAKAKAYFLPAVKKVIAFSASLIPTKSTGF